MPKNKVVALEDAIAHVQSGMSIAIGGFLAVGDPLTLIHGLKTTGVKDLTIYSCTGGFRDRGIVELVKAGMVRKLVASHVGTTPDVVKAMHAGELEIQLVPQGTLAEQMRSGGAGLGGFLTPTGVGTVVEEGKQKIELDGTTYLLERGIRVDVAFVRAHVGDTWGNLRYRATAANYNPVCATCADYTIAEVEYLYDPGEVAPETVQTPGIYVDAVVRSDIFYRGSAIFAGQCYPFE
ncbi:MAG: CoA transferase subunit A [Thermoleophilia bacterium]|jgi:acetate CoA/acetoacetate CoA-transferase alpha subunit